MLFTIMLYLSCELYNRAIINCKTQKSQIVTNLVNTSANQGLTPPVEWGENLDYVSHKDTNQMR